MKFGDKYELLDSLTTGSVETFVANDKVRGERVLVHILHCDPQRANQPTVQWVLDSFRRVAPEPAGLVLEAGRYSGTLYAYLITKLPDDAAVQGWVKQYKAQARDTQEITARVTQPVPPVPPPAPALVSSPPSAQPQSTPTPSSVTQLLREFEPLAKTAAPNVPPREAQQPPAPSPSPSISTAADRSGVRPAPPWNPEPSRTPIPQKAEPPRHPPVDAFPSNFLDKNFPETAPHAASPAAPPAKEGPKAGEFTSFFQGPFRGDRPSETPNISPPPEPPRKTVGDFTAMFGAVKPQPEEPPPTSGMAGKGMAGNEPAGTGFTGWFNSDIPSRTSGTPFGTIPNQPPSNIPSVFPGTMPNSFPNVTPNTTAPPSGLPRSADPAPVFPEPLRDPFAPPQPASYVAPAPPIFPAPTPPSPPMPNAAASTLPSDGATRAFSLPGSSEATPAPPPPPSGPSAYTQIISVRPPNPAGEAGTEKEAPKSITPPALTPPPMPPLPKLAPPPMPPAPAMPKFAAPAVPPPPKAPKVDVPVPPVSYWPLVLTLTIIFALIVLVVLYFVLKH
jgi:hypothetical protein